MDNNLPNEPPNGESKPPPPFGPDFNPHTNPPDHNNPYAAPPPAPTPNPQTTINPTTHKPYHHPPNWHHPTDEEKQHLSELAKQKPRDEHNHWIKTSNVPAIAEVNVNTQASDRADPPLFGFFLTNPVTYFKLFLKRLLKRQAITLRIPVLALVIIMAGIGGFGVGFQAGLNWTLFRLFPNYSPILHRAITEQGIIQKGKSGEYFLKSASNKSGRLWSLKSVSANVKLEDYVNQQVQIKGNLTPTPDLIEVSEVISFDTETDESLPDAEPVPAPQTTPDTSTKGSTNPDPIALPALYPNLNWEIPKNKTLTFTSGARKIEQEVVYIESLQSSTYPQDLIGYYSQQLTNSGFKQTLNTQEPNNISFTYAKGNLFLTFGVKNIYSGTGDNKVIAGYKAYIEHN